MVKKKMSPLQVECTVLFQTNPKLVMNIEGLITRLGRKKEELQPILEVLVTQGILQKTGAFFQYKEPVVTKEVDISTEVDHL